MYSTQRPATPNACAGRNGRFDVEAQTSVPLKSILKGTQQSATEQDPIEQIAQTVLDRIETRPRQSGETGREELQPRDCNDRDPCEGNRVSFSQTARVIGSRALGLVALAVAPSAGAGTAYWAGQILLVNATNKACTSFNDGVPCATNQSTTPAIIGTAICATAILGSFFSSTAGTHLLDKATRIAAGQGCD